MIVGTAGHIDHGKTALVRALTGVDTDRLKEEKARGISIELGYAYLPLAGDGVLGFIDVPGHERFVHTMLAGSAGIDFALLVVAADDGVMPQTREHVAILSLLAVRAGAVALTKVDRAPPERVAAVRAEVARLLAPTPLAAAPVFAVNSTAAGDCGIAALATHLRAAARERPSRRSGGRFRLAIDRAFTLAGHGTIVTGTAFAGRVEAGALLALAPAGIEVRVRAIHAQNRPAAIGEAGERCALNLAGIEAGRISRGDWLVDPRAAAGSTRVDARLTLLATEPAPLKTYAPLHVHFGATHATARALLLEGETLSPGDSTRVQLLFERTVCAFPGDHFIVRNAQASRTVGGGVLLDPRAPARGRRSSARRLWLDGLERTLTDGDVLPLLEASPWGMSLAALALATSEPIEPGSVPAGVRLVSAGRDEAERFLILERQWQMRTAELLAALAAFHVAEPAEAGPADGRLRRIAAPAAPERLWQALVEELVAAGRLERLGAWLQLPEHAAALSARERAATERLVPLLAAGRFDPPWVRELATVSGEPETRVRQLLAALGRTGRAHQVVHDLYYDDAAVAALAEAFTTLAREHGAVEAARFRDAVGVGRKRAIQILEFFDRVGYSRRVGAAHVPRRDGGWTGAR